MRLFTIVITCLLLAACGAEQAPPVIRFIGIATGTLVSDVRSLSFGDQFKTSDREIIAVVGFDEAQDGTTVQATWFSPDDRRMPMGRTSIVMDSGATLARFQLKNTVDWDAAPYMLDVRAWKQPQKNEEPKTASGQLHFFIGLETKDIQAYAQEFSEWKNREKERAAVAALQEKAQAEIVDAGRSALAAPEAIGLPVPDAKNVGSSLTFVLDTVGEEPFAPGLTGIKDQSVRQFAVLNESGSLLLSMTVNGLEKMFSTASETIDVSTKTALSVLPSGTTSVTWQGKEKICSIEFVWNGTAYSRGAGNCGE